MGAKRAIPISSSDVAAGPRQVVVAPRAGRPPLRRGVDVRVILPFRTDAGLIGRSNVLAANLLLRHGNRVYSYRGCRT